MREHLLLRVAFQGLERLLVYRCFRTLPLLQAALKDLKVSALEPSGVYITANHHFPVSVSRLWQFPFLRAQPAFCSGGRSDE